MPGCTVVRTARAFTSIGRIARHHTCSWASRYVGVSPKWVIKRNRLQDAAEQLAGGAVSCAQMALELGYFDQAHFIKDFKSIVGKSPAEYARSL